MNDINDNSLVGSNYVIEKKLKVLFYSQIALIIFGILSGLLAINTILLAISFLALLVSNILFIVTLYRLSINDRRYKIAAYFSIPNAVLVLITVILAVFIAINHESILNLDIANIESVHDVESTIAEIQSITAKIELIGNIISFPILFTRPISTYFQYTAHSSMLVNRNEDLSEKFKNLTKWYLIPSIFIILFSAVEFFLPEIGGIGLFFAESILSIVEIIYLVYLKRMANEFSY